MQEALERCGMPMVTAAEARRQMRERYGWVRNAHQQNRALAKNVSRTVQQNKGQRKALVGEEKLVKTLADLQKVIYEAAQQGRIGLFAFIPSVRSYMLAQRMMEIMPPPAMKVVRQAQTEGLIAPPLTGRMVADMMRVRCPSSQPVCG